MWVNKDNPLVTFLDIHPEVKPTFVCDTRNIPAEVGYGFNLIVFDPPHDNFGANSQMSQRYGHHTGPEISDIIKGSAAEAHRIAAPDALMAFKWNDRAKKLETVLDLLAPFWKPLCGQIVGQRPRRLNAEKYSSSYWVLLLKSPTVGNDGSVGDLNA